MNIQIRRLLAVYLAVVGGCMLAVSEFRSPLSIDRGTLHYPFMQPADAWWYDRMQKSCGVDHHEDRLWSIDKWVAGYYRTADKAFYDECSACPRHVTTKTSSLSTLWFNKKSFTIAQAFTDEEVEDPSGNPFLVFSQLTPQFMYSEKGAYIGVHFDHKFAGDKRWSIGTRVSLPFKIIDIEQTFGCTSSLEEGLGNVMAEQPINVDADENQDQVAYAYRLDFLGTLIRPAIPSSDSRPIVEYAVNATTGVNETQIAGVIVTGANSFTPPVYVTRSVNGSIPAKPFQKFPGQVTASLNADGSGGANGETLFFRDGNINYLTGLGASVEAQRQLFLVPQITGTALTEEAVAIRSAIRDVLESFEFSNASSATDFLQSRCIDLCSDKRVTGLGDLRLEIYGKHTRETWFAGALIGAIFPTGKELKNATDVFFVPTGSNGHIIAMLGGEGGWRPRDWFGVNIYGMFGHACTATEKKASAFEGAVIQNIGTSLDAKVSWNQFVFRANVNAFNPCNTDLGCTIGYEFFVKSKDNVSFCQTTAKDLLCNTHTLNPCLLEETTNTLTHKIDGEVFHRWDYCEIFMGASQIVAGRNAMKETEAHIGMVVYF